MSNLTPDDLAAIRAWADSPHRVLTREEGYERNRQIHALCDALEAAWAERDIAYDEILEVGRQRDHFVARAERAEADYARAKLSLIEEGKQTKRWHDEFEAHRDALARVRALCDEMESFCCDASPDWAADIRAAIEGEAGR